jgi:hypothetical protein
MVARFDPDYKGIGELLCADFMIAEMARRAENVKGTAEATAPDAVPLGVGYKYEFEVTSGVKVSKKGTKRAYGRVTNHSDHARAVEYGLGNTPKHRTLGRALDAAGD